MSCQPASGHAPAARDSNPCRGEGERRQTQSAAAESVCCGKRVMSGQLGLCGREARGDTHGSGECMGEEAWRMYCVHWKTRKARLARKSRAESRPATGRSWKPVLSGTAHTRCAGRTAPGLLHQPNPSAPPGNSTCSSGAQRDRLTTGLPYSHSPLCPAAGSTTWALPLSSVSNAQGSSYPPKSQPTHYSSGFRP